MAEEPPQQPNPQPTPPPRQNPEPPPRRDQNAPPPRPRQTPSSPPPPRPTPPPQERPEKLERLNREEVRTMHRDEARLRERESHVERERITQLRAQERAQKEQEMVEKIRQASQEQKVGEQQRRAAEEQGRREQAARRHENLERQAAQTQAATREQEAEQKARERLEQQTTRQKFSVPQAETPRAQAPSRRGPTKKSGVFVRVLVILIIAFVLINIALFGYLRFVKGDQGFSFSFSSVTDLIPDMPNISLSIPFLGGDPEMPQEPTQPTPPPLPQQPPEPTEPTEPPPSPTAPSSVLAQQLGISRSATVQFGTSQELSSTLTSLVNDRQQPQGLQHLIMTSRDSAATLNPASFFALFGTQLPAVLQSQLAPDAPFFLYTYERGTRLGFVATVQNPSEVSTTLQGWEAMLEQDITPFSAFWGDKGTGYTSEFRVKPYRGVDLHFQTFSLQDTGIVYAVASNNLVFSSSYEATKAVVDRILDAG